MDAGHSAVVIANIGAEIGRRRMTQKALGELIGMSPAAISERQRGQTKWTVDEVGAVADALGISLAALVTDPALAVPFQGGSVGTSAPIAQLAELRTFNPLCALAAADARALDTLIATGAARTFSRVALGR